MLHDDIDQATELGEHRDKHGDLCPPEPDHWPEAAGEANSAPLEPVPEPPAEGHMLVLQAIEATITTIPNHHCCQ